MLISKARKYGPTVRDDRGGDDPIYNLVRTGNPLIGTNNSDFLLAQQSDDIRGLDGDDLILGDGDFVMLTNVAGNNSFGTAYDLDTNVDWWSRAENPLFAPSAQNFPHMTAYVQAEAGVLSQEYYRINLTAGQVITIDIDGGGGALGGAGSVDTIVRLYLSSNTANPVASNDDSAITAGGFGSISTADSFLSYTVTTSGTYIIRIGKVAPAFQPEDFDGGEEFLLNIQVSGHAFGTLDGGLSDDLLQGGEGNDHLFGGSGNDELFGGPGVDLLHGGSGSDKYVVDDNLDTIVEAAGDGSDRIITSASYVLAAGVSVELMLTDNSGGTAAIDLTGNEIRQEIDGNAASNTLRGEGGDDTLFGGRGSDFLFGGDGSDILNGEGGPDDPTGNDLLDGGTGADTMRGENGDDIYMVDSAADVIVEIAGKGFDRVLTTVDYTLAEGVYAERLEAADAAGTAPLALGGNALENVIYGNAGSNILYGKGGFDTLFGGAGDDYYYVSDAGDFIVELAGGGFDRILTSVDYSLNDEGLVEVISTDSNSGTAALALGGNNHENIIIGNDGNNILYGKGGFDTIYGRAGNDTYYVSDAGDLIVELQNEGNDRIYASVDYTLFDDGYVETLSTEFIAGTANLSLGGNNLANTLIGNNGNNTLYGKGGADTLYGHGGADTFLFVTKGAGDVDAIGDFVSGTDKIAFYQSVYTGLASGTLSASAFVIGSAAADGDDRIIYNQATGALFYDADGTGAQAAIQFATVTPGQNLVASDFVVM